MKNKIGHISGYKASSESGVYRFICSGPCVDRQDEIVLIDGLDCSTYERTKSWQWRHQQGEISDTIGKNLLLEKSSSFLIGDFMFHDADDLSKLAHKLVDFEALNSISIGFKELESHFDNIDGRRVKIITKSDLYEISLCALPVNQMATRIKSLDLTEDEKIILEDYELIDKKENKEKSIMDNYTEKAGAKFSADSKKVFQKVMDHFDDHNTENKALLKDAKKATDAFDEEQSKAFAKKVVDHLSLHTKSNKEMKELCMKTIKDPEEGDDDGDEDAPDGDSNKAIEELNSKIAELEQENKSMKQEIKNIKTESNKKVLDSWLKRQLEKL